MRSSTVSLAEVALRLGVSTLVVVLGVAAVMATRMSDLEWGYWATMLLLSFPILCGSGIELVIVLLGARLYRTANWMTFIVRGLVVAAVLMIYGEVWSIPAPFLSLIPDPLDNILSISLLAVFTSMAVFVIAYCWRRLQHAP